MGNNVKHIKSTRLDFKFKHFHHLLVDNLFDPNIRITYSMYDLT